MIDCVGWCRGFIEGAREAGGDRAVVALYLIPLRVGLMIGAVRACTGASAMTSAAALGSAVLVWLMVEFGIIWATHKPGAPPKINLACDEFIALCGGRISAKIGRCEIPQCIGGHACETLVSLEIEGESIVNGFWRDIRDHEATAAWRAEGGDIAERMFLAIDRAQGD